MGSGPVYTQSQAIILFPVPWLTLMSLNNTQDAGAEVHRM